MRATEERPTIWFLAALSTQLYPSMRPGSQSIGDSPPVFTTIVLAMKPPQPLRMFRRPLVGPVGVKSGLTSPSCDSAVML